VPQIHCMLAILYMDRRMPMLLETVAWPKLLVLD